jgi:hypothetical protein
MVLILFPFLADNLNRGTNLVVKALNANSKNGEVVVDEFCHKCDEQSSIVHAYEGVLVFQDLCDFLKSDGPFVLEGAVGFLEEGEGIAVARDDHGNLILFELANKERQI